MRWASVYLVSTMKRKQWQKLANTHLKAHHRGVGDSRLVQIVEAVDNTQQRHQIPVDLAQQTLLLLGRHHHCIGTVCSEELQSLVGIVNVGVLEA